MTHPRPDNGRPQHWTADTGQHDGLVPVPARVRVRELLAERHRVAMEFRERRAPMAERAARALLPIVSDRGERWPDSAAVMAALNIDADTLLATLRAGNRGRRCRHGRRLWYEGERSGSEAMARGTWTTPSPAPCRRTSTG